MDRRLGVILLFVMLVGCTSTSSEAPAFGGPGCISVQGPQEDGGGPCSCLGLRFLLEGGTLCLECVNGAWETTDADCLAPTSDSGPTSAAASTY